MARVDRHALQPPSARLANAAITSRPGRQCHDHDQRNHDLAHLRRPAASLSTGLSSTPTSCASGSARSATPCRTRRSESTPGSAAISASRWSTTTTRPSAASSTRPSPRSSRTSCWSAHQDVEGIPGTTGSVRFRLRLEFHAEPGGKTRLELRQGPFRDQIGEDAVKGWESSFTKLDSLLRRSL